MPSLSPREKEVLTLLAKGCTYKQVGVQLGISWRTVESYTRRAKEKLGQPNRRSVVSKAQELNLITCA